MTPEKCIWASVSPSVKSKFRKSKRPHPASQPCLIISVRRFIQWTLLGTAWRCRPQQAQLGKVWAWWSLCNCEGHVHAIVFILLHVKLIFSCCLTDHLMHSFHASGDQAPGSIAQGLSRLNQGVSRTVIPSEAQGLLQSTFRCWQNSSLCGCRIDVPVFWLAVG